MASRFVMSNESNSSNSTSKIASDYISVTMEHSTVRIQIGRRSHRLSVIDACRLFMHLKAILGGEGKQQVKVSLENMPDDIPRRFIGAVRPLPALYEVKDK